jgi:hypothetical protein
MVQAADVINKERPNRKSLQLRIGSWRHVRRNRQRDNQLRVEVDHTHKWVDNQTNQVHLDAFLEGSMEGLRPHPQVSRQSD